MKIKYALLEKLFQLTNREIDLLLYIARYQDDHGQIRGIYYRTACEACDMCKQTFYNSLRSLEKKGVVEVSHVDSDFDIRILDNDFSYPESYSEGYVNVNRQVFRSAAFRKLRAKEKVFVMVLMKITHNAYSSYQIGVEKFYDKYMQMIGVTKKVLRSYLHTMKNFFTVGRKDGKYFITITARLLKMNQELESDQYLNQQIVTGCRRHKITIRKDKDVKDVSGLVKQYRSYASEVERDIWEIIDLTLKQCRGTVLNPKYIHKLVRSQLEMA